ncbi:hypothetical protein ACWEVO_31985, partial [Micromonospora sp. NPDC003776]
GLGTCAGYPAAMYLIRAEARRTGRDSPSGVLFVGALAALIAFGRTLGPRPTVNEDEDEPAEA